MKKMIVVGGGLAGCEAAWQIATRLEAQGAERSAKVELWEMRPGAKTPAHQTDRLGELVCSNSLKSDAEFSAPWLLKEELRRLNSLLMDVARETRVPGGQALAVDREKFAVRLTERIASHLRIQVRRQECVKIPDGEEVITIIATGPLTSPSLSSHIREWTGLDHLFFFDAISPIVEADSVDESIAFKASRYGKGGEDYLNCPMSRQEYDVFFDALIAARCVPTHEFEQEILTGVSTRELGCEKYFQSAEVSPPAAKGTAEASAVTRSDPTPAIAMARENKSVEKTPYFEGCLPIEELARRGRDTLRFGPMKPVGLVDPRTGRMPWACVQLRQESLMAESYNLVGFQNHLRFPEQERVFRMIPGLSRAEFVRFGQMHRNTYINSPRLLVDTLQMRMRPDVFFAGQLVGVEGYVESIMTGLVAGLNAVRLASGKNPSAPPTETACGALLHYITHAPPRNFQPMNIVFSLLPPVEGRIGQGKKIPKAERHRLQCEVALGKLEEWKGRLER